MWATGERPSRLRKVFWSHSHEDLKSIVNIRSQWEIARAYQIHESFRLVAAEALGGGNSTTSAPSSGVKPVEDMAELMAAFGSVGGRIG